MSTARPGEMKVGSPASLAPPTPEADQLRAVYDLALAVTRAGALSEIYTVALDALQASLGAERASILLFDAGGVMRFAAWRGLSDGYRRSVEGHSPWAPGTRGARPVVVPDVDRDEALAAFRETLRAEGIRALAFIPLYSGDNLLGKFMVYFDAPHAFAPEEVRLSEIIANHVAYAVERRRSEEKLNLYREIFAHSNDAIAILDVTGGYLEQNGAHESLVGYGAEEIAGRTPAVHLGEEAFAEIVRELARAGALQREVRSRTKSGAVRDVDLAAFTVRDEKGAPVCYVGIKRDITERKRAEGAVRFLAEASGRLDASLDYDATLATVAQLAVAHLADWCLVEVAEEGNPLRVAAAHANAAQADLVQRLRGLRLAARSAFAVADDQPARSRLGAEALDLLLRQFAAGEGADVVQRLGAAFAMRVPLIARGRTLGTVTFVSASPARRYAAADLAVAQDLGRRAGLALDNARLYREAQESDRRKDEFLAMLAHELRNPLAPVLTALQLMELRPDDGSVAERARGVLGRQVRHMTRLIDDLLDVSRITRGKITLRTERVDLAEVAGRALEAARPLLEGRRLEVSVGLPPGLWVQADPVRMEQVVLNLLNNAGKFTEPGGRVRVWAEAANGRVTIGVSDNGIGIAPEMIPRIFDLFMQGERSLDRAQGGLGIGLTLVRRLVELHHGTVMARSAGPGEGSEFVVELPLAAARAGAERTPAPPPARATAPRRILIVDDNVDAASTLAQALGDIGHEVGVAHDGRAAVERAARERPDVVLLDIGLPGMDGYAVARRLRATPGLDQTVLIAVSGYGQVGDRERTQEAGFRDHLVKPVDVHTLAALLAT